MSAASLAAPSSLAFTGTGSSFVGLQWKDNAATATGYNILRSADGVHYSVIAKLTTGKATTYDDTTALSGRWYDYEIQAISGTTTSAASNVAAGATLLNTPTAVTAKITGTSVTLNWTDNDSLATGYYIYRSQDNVNFNLVATVTGETANSYTQLFPAYGKGFYFRVVAFGAVAKSAPSASAYVATPTADVTVTTRYGDELVITAAGADDLVSVVQSGTTLTITADRETFTDNTTAGGLFIYTRGGTDTIDIANSVTADTTVETIDAALTTIASEGTDVTAWIDSTDSYTGTGTVHRVASFAGGVSKATGASLANPTDSGTTVTANASLFGTGPVIGDINQGEVGDCYFLGSLGAFAQQDPQILVQSAVDMGDGTYTVQFDNNGTPEYVRVNNQFPAGPFGGYMYAHPGADGSIWAMVFEKAFAYFRTGANTYASINGGWMGEAYSDLGVNSEGFFPDSYTTTSLYTMLSTDLADGQEVTLATSSSAPNLVSDHCYTLVSAYVSNGTDYYVVRNPWGTSGDSLETSQGYATLTYAQLVANFAEGCVST